MVNTCDVGNERKKRQIGRKRNLPSEYKNKSKQLSEEFFLRH